MSTELERTSSEPFRTVLHTLLTAAFSLIGTMLMKTMFRFKEVIHDGPYDAQTICNSVLTGLVASAGGVTNMETWACVVVGFIAGVLYYLTIVILEHVKFDDPCDATAVYLVGGIWGIFSMAFLDQDRGVVYPTHKETDRGNYFAY